MRTELLQKNLGGLEGSVMINLCYGLGKNTEGWYDVFPIASCVFALLLITF